MGEPVAEYPVSYIEIHTQQVRTCEEDFGEVTGIVSGPDQRTADVHYTTVITRLTPFASASNECVDGRTAQHRAQFLKYDDGWRLEGVR